MTKIAPARFHNLKGYDSHLIMHEMGKFHLKVNVIPNGLEKDMAFTIITILFLLTGCNLWTLV